MLVHVFLFCFMSAWAVQFKSEKRIQIDVVIINCYAFSVFEFSGRVLCGVSCVALCWVSYVVLWFVSQCHVSCVVQRVVCCVVCRAQHMFTP